MKDYQSPNFGVESVELEFDLKESETIVNATLRLQTSNLTATACVLNGIDHELESAESTGRELVHELTDESLIVNNVQAAVFSLRTSVRIHPEKNMVCV